MFGGSSGHQQAQDSSSTHSGRPSSSVNAPPRGVADVPMADAGAPPSSSTPAQRSQQHDASAASPHTATQQPAPPSSPRFRPHSQQPTPSATQTRTVPSSGSTPAQASPAQAVRSPAESNAASPRKIKVTSLAHIQSFAVDESSPFSQTRSLSRRQRRDPADVGPQYEISEMPVSDIIEMVAGLLTKITTTNDRQHDHLHRQIPPVDGTSGLSQQTTSVLAFHGKNVPSISILSYLSRIHKYCPTTYEVFLSLLVYFDRMTERVNAGPMLSLRQANQQSLERSEAAATAATAATAPAVASQAPSSAAQAQAATPPPSGSLGRPQESPAQSAHPPSPPQQDLDSNGYNLSHFFVVDSFNIHRLVIAGVTCASKFFSDVFYTNSRYAKVGGLPLVELNHLELQFLLLNDFRLAVPLEEMEAYGTMLVEFYAREVVEQHERQSAGRQGVHGEHTIVTMGNSSRFYSFRFAASDVSAMSEVELDNVRDDCCREMYSFQASNAGNVDESGVADTSPEPGKPGNKQTQDRHLDPHTTAAMTASNPTECPSRRPVPTQPAVKQKTGVSSSLHLTFLAATALAALVFTWPFRWIVSGAPQLIYALLLGEAYGYRILPFIPLWTIFATVNFVYAVCSTSWLLFWVFWAACWPTFVVACLFQFDAPAGLARRISRKTFLRDLHFINDQVAFFDLPALEIDTEVKGLFVIRGVTLSLSTLTLVAHGIEAGIKLSDEVELGIQVDKVTVPLFREIRVDDVYANIKGGEWEVTFGDVPYGRPDPADEDSDDSMIVADTAILKAAAAARPAEMVRSMTADAPPTDSEDTKSAFSSVKQLSPDDEKAHQKYRQRKQPRP
ncbi:hypothetical protein OPT61_g9091 [Boeremia exigua]|uniref:Uncharacterized protein n=1 Tax=Boeremia exigua TaxID=749465 RepID=A0ACC2HVK9_9PLEO|nr:hypothetical protein OPT61_g9091 [Boeremia exigua]